MRRPLADLGLFFILIILILQIFIPHKYPDLSDIIGRTTKVSGILNRIEYKEKNDALFPVFIISSNEPNISDIICYMPSNSALPPLGSRITISGKVTGFDASTNPGCFDKQKYYETIGISFAVYDAVLISVSEGESAKFIWRCKNLLCILQKRISKLIDLCFGEEDSGIIKTMILGDKSTLDSELKTIYSANGIAHILSISGLHVSLLGMSLFKLIKKMGIPTSLSASMSILLLLAYGVLVGMPTSAVRAIIMFIFSMVAKIIRRTSDALTSLVFSALILLIENPLYIFYSGFLFSYGALLGFILIPEMFPQSSNKKILGIISSNAFTLPVYLYNYYYFPLFSLLLNIVIIPFMTLLIPSIILSLLLGAINLSLGRCIGVVPHLILLMYKALCSLGDFLPINQLINGKPQIFQVYVYVLIIIITYIFRSRLTQFQIYLHLTLAGIILCFHFSFGTAVTFIDVGQGDGIYITDNNGIDILIDGGSSSINNVGEYVLSPFLLSNGVSNLDAVFITHLDSDHYNGILNLMNSSNPACPKISNLYLTTATLNQKTKALEELLNLAKQKNITIHSVSEGDQFLSSSFKMSCLYPSKKINSEDTNANSLVMEFEYGKNILYLTGDLEGEGEEYLINHLPQRKKDDTVILKVAHHGSKNSTSDELLSVIKPNIAIISVGKNNSYGHPNKELLHRLSANNTPFYSTKDYGALTLKFHNNTMNLYGYLTE